MDYIKIRIIFNTTFDALINAEKRVRTLRNINDVYETDTTN